MDCPKCGFVRNANSTYGRLCNNCGFFIESFGKYPITEYMKHNKETSDNLKKDAINAVKKRIKFGENNGNKK